MPPDPGKIDPRQALPIAIRHHQSHRLAEAEAIYRDILAFDPNHVDSLHLSGVIANQTGRHQAAIDSIGRAIALRKQNPVAEFHNNIGVAFRAIGQLDTALNHFARAATLKPGYAEAHFNFGAILKEIGRLKEAEASTLRALALRPDYASAHYNLGNILREQGRLNEATESYKRALSFRPNHAETHNNLGVILKDLGRLDEAEAQCRAALALKPDYMSAEYNLGIALEEQGRLDEALACYVRAQEFAPDYADAHWNEALLRLLRGELPVGWRKFEWRMARKETQTRQFGLPRWQGENLVGGTILLHAEQGFGDSIQFIRYARLVKERVAKVVVECQPGLERLLKSAPGVDQVVVRGDALPAFDRHAPLLSLPYIFGTVLETIPNEVPYLSAQPDLIEAWRARGIHGPYPNIGIVWHGNPQNTISHKKSIPVELMARLCAVPNIRWFSMQADASADEIRTLSRNGEVRDFGRLLADWADTAALISALDLVIAADTGVAHLAGALGKPAWILLSHIPDWRWELERSHSSWYPTLRLFRQLAPGDWSGLLLRVQDELTHLGG